MENLKYITTQIKELEKQKRDVEKNTEESFYQKFKFKNKDTTVSLVNDKFLSIEVADYADLTNFFKNNKPYRNSHRVKHGSFEHDIVNPYKIDIESTARGVVSMRFTSYLVNNFMIWVKINIDSVLPSYLIDKYTSPMYRRVTSSEHHYFTGVSYRELSELRIYSKQWRGYQLDWYGGGKTLLTHDKNSVYSSVLDDFINELTNNPNLSQY